MREAAVYVIVLMLPLVFAAMVWPARRVWAIRAVELLVALILSKFAIVAVLALGGAALGHSVGHSVTGLLAGSCSWCWRRSRRGRCCACCRSPSWRAEPRGVAARRRPGTPAAQTPSTPKRGAALARPTGPAR